LVDVRPSLLSFHAHGHLVVRQEEAPGQKTGTADDFSNILSVFRWLLRV
jgi:hypothetical protein